MSLARERPRTSWVPGATSGSTRTACGGPWPGPGRSRSWLIALGTEPAQDRDVRVLNARRAGRSFGAVPSDPRQHLGRLGEQLAAEHLERLGGPIVGRNHRPRHGEIDPTADDGMRLILVQGKNRRGPGVPWEALHGPH